MNPNFCHIFPAGTEGFHFLQKNGFLWVIHTIYCMLIYYNIYILDGDTQPVPRATGVSHTACKDEFRQNLRSHSWSVFFFLEKTEMPHVVMHLFKQSAGELEFHDGKNIFSPNMIKWANYSER